MIDPNIEKIFDIPIYYATINNIDVINEIESNIDQIKFSMIESWGQTHYLSDTTFETDTLRKYNLNNFLDEINENLKIYCENINFKMSDYYIKSWFSLFKKNNYAHVHDHTGSDISGVFYYKTNGDDGDLVFHNINPYIKMSRCYINYNNSWVHKPSVGKIILFPSWLPHGVTTNKTDDTRISFSFNINFI